MDPQPEFPVGAEMATAASNEFLTSWGDGLTATDSVAQRIAQAGSTVTVTSQ